MFASQSVFFASDHAALQTCVVANGGTVVASAADATHVVVPSVLVGFEILETRAAKARAKPLYAIGEDLFCECFALSCVRANCHRRGVWCPMYSLWGRRRRGRLRRCEFAGAARVVAENL